MFHDTLSIQSFPNTIGIESMQEIDLFQIHFNTFPLQSEQEHKRLPNSI